MADVFLQSLKELERRSHDDVMSFSDVLTKRLDDLAEAMIHHNMSDNDYIKLCELYYQRYVKENNRDGMLFCLLRIQQIIQYKKKPRNQRMFPRLSFSKRVDLDTKEFLMQKRYYYRMQYNQFKRRLIKSVVAMMILLLFVLSFVANIHFFNAWMSSIVCGVISYALGVFYVFDRMYEQSLENMRKTLNDIHMRVDKSIQKEM